MIHDVYLYFSNLPRWNIFAVFFIGYSVYYVMEVAKRPFLAVKDGPFKDYLIKHVPVVASKFWPTFWCVESRAQTIFASLLRQKVLAPLDYRREILSMKDGGEIALDWMDNDCNDDSPVILLLPGLTGASQAEYIKCFVRAGCSMGARIAVFNNRGLGGVALKTPRLYCAANVEDVAEVIQHIAKLHPDAKKGAVGVSMGGLVLGNYLALHSEEARRVFTACKIISVPWNVHKGSDSIEKPFLNNMLGKHLVDSLCATLSKYDILTQSKDYDIEKVLNSKTIKEFDSNFTSKHFGYRDVDHYYSMASVHNKLHKITVPLLCLSAADDPFQPFDAIPTEAAEASSHVAICVTARGGHIGFLDGIWPKTSDEYMARLFKQYFSAALFDNELHDVSEKLMENFASNTPLMAAI